MNLVNYLIFPKERTNKKRKVSIGNEKTNIAQTEKKSYSVVNKSLGCFLTSQKRAFNYNVFTPCNVGRKSSVLSLPNESRIDPTLLPVFHAEKHKNNIIFNQFRMLWF